MKYFIFVLETSTRKQKLLMMLCSDICQQNMLQKIQKWLMDQPVKMNILITVLLMVLIGMNLKVSIL